MLLISGLVDAALCSPEGLPVHKKEPRLAGSPGFPVARHLCTRQNLTTAVTMKASTKEESLGVDQEGKNDGWKTDNEAGLSDRAKLGVLVEQVALPP